MSLADARERRSSIAVHLQKYSDLLTEVRDASKAAKLEIKNSADEVLRNHADHDKACSK